MQSVLHVIGYTPQMEDKSNKLLSMETQLKWLGEIGFVDVVCYWKWLEMAFFIGYKAYQNLELLLRERNYSNYSPCYRFNFG